MAGEDDGQDERRELREQHKDITFDPEDSDRDEPMWTGGRPDRGSGHVSGDVEWVASDEDDPDGGSGRTDADDGGYLPGEGTGRPYR